MVIAQLAQTTTSISPMELILRIFLPILPWIILLLVFVAIVSVVVRLLSGGTSSLPNVKRTDPFISPSEVEFYWLLKDIVSERAVILAQVALNRLISFPGNNESNPGRQTWWNKMCRRSVDFVLVDVKTLQPLLVIELNDSSHEREDRILRDEEVKAILEKAGVPILPVRAARTYDRKALATAINRSLL